MGVLPNTDDREQLAAVVEACNDAIFLKDLSGTVVTWNKAAQELYGYSAEEMVGRRVAILAPPDRLDEIDALIERIRRGEAVADYETQRLHKDGRILDVALSLGAVRDAQGAIVGAAVVARYIGESIRREAELRKSREEFAVAQQLARIGSWSSEFESGVVHWSPEMFTILGYADEDAVPSYELFMSRVHPDDRAAIEQRLGHALRECSGYDEEIRLIREDGGVRVVASAVRVMADTTGRPERLIGSLRDITEQRETERQLQLAAAEAASRAIRDSLTGLLNHGGFQDALDAEVARSQRYGRPFSLILFDLDGFKAINDTFGHAAGDRALREVAAALQSACRPSDVIGRLGGDEFALLLPETSAEDAGILAARLQESLSTLPMRVKTSFGIAEWPRDGIRGEAVLYHADMDLYAAKDSSGRRLRATERLVEGLEADSVMAAEPEAAQRAAGPASATETVEAILQTVREELSMDVAYLGEFQKDLQVITAVEGTEGPPGIQPGLAVRVEETYCLRVITGELDGLIPDAQHDPRVKDLPVTCTAGIGSYAGVPIRFSDGRTWGTLCCASREASPSLAERDLAFMRVLGRLLAEQLERRYRAESRHRAELEDKTIDALLGALDTRDNYTGEHSCSVVQLATEVAQAMRLQPHVVAEVAQVARLHDLGKIGIPDSILNKQGPLDESEWRVMRQHPIIGADLVARIPPLAHLAPPIRAEHERWDGAGYPDGLSGSAIPLASRIVFACDAYHAMTSDRPYRRSMPKEDAWAELAANAGSQFDPKVVDALTSILERASTVPSPSP